MTGTIVLRRVSVNDPGRVPAQGHARHGGSGTVIDADAAKASVRLEHGPIPSLKWPSMTMPFTVADRKQLAGVKPGDTVEFELRAEPETDGSYVIESIRHSPAASLPADGKAGGRRKRP